MKINFNTRMLEGFDLPSNIERGALLLGERRKGGHWLIDAVAELPNRHPFPADNYRMLSQDAVEYIGMRRSKRVIGAMHTHLPGHAVGPSEDDLASMPTGFLGLVLNIECGTITYYTNKGIADQRRIYL